MGCNCKGAKRHIRTIRNTISICNNCENGVNLICNKLNASFKAIASNKDVKCPINKF